MKEKEDDMKKKNFTANDRTIRAEEPEGFLPDDDGSFDRRYGGRGRSPGDSGAGG